ADGDDVVALLAVDRGNALECQVVALGGAGGEDDLLGAGADEGRDLLAGRLDGFLRVPAEAVIAARRVAVVLGEEGQHRLDDARITAGRGVVVQVNGKLDHIPRDSTESWMVVPSPVFQSIPPLCGGVFFFRPPPNR